MTPRIALVEDNRAIRYLVTNLLRRAGYRVLATTTGEHGVELILEKRPDLVLLDLDLPGIDGYDVLRRVRSDARGRNVTVLAFTATVGERDRAIEWGFDGYIGKPIDPVWFVRRVGHILSKTTIAQGLSA